MALTMWGQLIVQAATPGEDPVQIGTAWVDTSSTPVLKLCTAVSPYTFATASGGVSDGDKGDITVTGSGATWTIDNDVVSDAKLRNSGALSVVGRSANSTGDPADISAVAASAAVLRESGSTLGFGTIATAGIADAAVTPAKMDNGAAVSVLGRSANSSGVRADIAAAADGDFLRRRSSAVTFGSVLSSDIDGLGIPVEQSSSTSGTNNNFSLTAEYTYLRYTSGSNATFTGFTIGGSAPTTNAVLLLHVVGDATVTFAHQSGSSTAAHRLVNRLDCDISITKQGMALLVYDVTSARWVVHILNDEIIEATTTSTGTQNDFSVTPIAGETHLRVNNASAVTFTGFTLAGVTPVKQYRVIIDNVGSSTVKVTHQDTGSSASNRVICPSTAGQIIGAGGRMMAVYDDTTNRWRLTVIDAGAPISWTPTDTSGDALTFTNVAAAYQQHGNRVFIRFILKYPSTASGTASKIGSFPFTHSGEIGYAAGLTACATPMYLWGATATTDCFPIKQAGGTSLTNAELSLCFVNGSGDITIA